MCAPLVHLHVQLLPHIYDSQDQAHVHIRQSTRDSAAHIRQSRQDSGFDVQVKLVQTFYGVPFPEAPGEGVEGAGVCATLVHLHMQLLPHI